MVKGENPQDVANGEARGAALQRVLAAEASRLPAVRDFRRKSLRGRLLKPEGVHRWVRQHGGTKALHDACTAVSTYCGWPYKRGVISPARTFVLSGETPPSRQDSISLEIPAEGHIGSAFWAIEVSVHIWPGELADYFEKRREEILGSSTFRGFFPDADFSQLTRRVTRINPRWLDLAAFTAENNDGSKTWQELMDAWEDQGREVTRGGLTAFIASARSAYVRVTGRKLVWKRKR